MGFGWALDLFKGLRATVHPASHASAVTEGLRGSAHPASDASATGAPAGPVPGPAAGTVKHTSDSGVRKNKRAAPDNPGGDRDNPGGDRGGASKPSSRAKVGDAVSEFNLDKLFDAEHMNKVHLAFTDARFEQHSVAAGDGSYAATWTTVKNAWSRYWDKLASSSQFAGDVCHEDCNGQAQAGAWQQPCSCDKLHRILDRNTYRALRCNYAGIPLFLRLLPAGMSGDVPNTTKLYYNALKKRILTTYVRSIQHFPAASELVQEGTDREFTKEFAPGEQGHHEWWDFNCRSMIDYVARKTAVAGYLFKKEKVILTRFQMLHLLSALTWQCEWTAFDKCSRQLQSALHDFGWPAGCPFPCNVRGLRNAWYILVEGLYCQVRGSIEHIESRHAEFKIQWDATVPSDDTQGAWYARPTQAWKLTFHQDPHKNHNVW